MQLHNVGGVTNHLGYLKNFKCSGEPKKHGCLNTIMNGTVFFLSCHSGSIFTDLNLQFGQDKIQFPSYKFIWKSNFRQKLSCKVLSPHQRYGQLQLCWLLMQLADYSGTPQGQDCQKCVTKFIFHRIQKYGSYGMNICQFMNSVVKNKKKIGVILGYHINSNLIGE